MYNKSSVIDEFIRNKKKVQLPKLRINELDIYPIEYEKKMYFCVKDIKGYQDDILLLTPELIFIASFLDGKNDYEIIKTVWAKNFQGQVITNKDIDEAIKILDEKLLLDSENFFTAKSKITEQFIKEPIRKLYLNGKSYPNNTEELNKFLSSFFTTQNGPGIIEKDNMLIKNVKGIIAPHIDFLRGGYCYAYAYKELAESIRTKNVMIFGVSHSSPPYPFILLDKDFETPYGVLKYDDDFSKYLPDNLYKKLTEHQFAHKIEHSIEFQTIWLKYIWNNEEISIIPILCSILPDSSMMEEFNEFIEICKKYIADRNGDVVVISGSDLSHIGPRFGDNIKITEQLIKWMENEDLKSLACCENIDADRFLQLTLLNNDIKKVCGLSSIYTTLRVLSGISEKGKLLKYGYAPDPAGGIVSFASLVFT